MVATSASALLIVENHRPRMSHTADKTDAKFYKMIHQLIESQRKTNRRGQDRNPFVSIQQIAPLYGQSLPNRSDFFKVRCNDLTTRGFSFFINDAPDFDKLVIAFESPAKAIYVHAEVRHHRKVLLYPKSGRVETLDDYARYGEYLEGQAALHTREAGIPMTLVGCCFTGRFY